MTASRLRRALVFFVLTALVGGVSGCAKRKAQQAQDRSFLSAEALYRRGIERLAQDNLVKAREDLERITFSVHEIDTWIDALKTKGIAIADGDDIKKRWRNTINNLMLYSGQRKGRKQK